MPTSTLKPALPDWAQVLPQHLAPGTLEGRNVIFYRHIDGVFWDSACRMCQGRTAVNELMPNHRPSPACRSGGHHHCTCDACF